jgi:molybdopterin-synthase adenylyltransferase
MSGPRLTLLSSQHEQLVDFLCSHPHGHERAAIILFRRLSVQLEGLAESDRYIAHEIILFDDDWTTGSSKLHVGFNLAPLRDLFRRCEEENFVFGFVHNHPDGPAGFSSTDEKNEQTLLSALCNRNGPDITFVAMLWAEEGWHARVRHGHVPENSVPVRHTLVIGNRIELYGYRESSPAHTEIQARQVAVFGQAFVDMIQSLRVGIVGTGGTGSPLATLGARAGVGELVLIDDDNLDASNLNRVRGLFKRDEGEKKAEKLKCFIDAIGVSVETSFCLARVDEDPMAVDALASCDVVFGCTDDFSGRDAMNIAAYIYAQAYIDLGLGGRVIEDVEGNPVLRYHHGRISTILPEAGECLFCQGVIKDAWIQTQIARRENPDITDEELKERYLEDGGEGAPGVGPFTSATADFALATLFDLIKPYRRYPPEVRRDMFEIDFINMEIRSRQVSGDMDCPYCQRHEFLLLNENYRLERPFLGKRDGNN